MTATTDVIQVSRVKYERLQEMAKIDWRLVDKVKRSFEDIKYGRITEVKHSK